MNRLHLTCALFGLAFGAVFAAAGFNQYDVIHRMLLLEDAGGFLTMGSAVGTAMLLLWWLERRRWQTTIGGPLALRRWNVERKHFWGGIVFGTGWAITGACPGTASTTLGAGSVMGIVLVIGMIAGIALRDFTVRPATPVTPARTEPTLDAATPAR